MYIHFIVFGLLMVLLFGSNAILTACAYLFHFFRWMAWFTIALVALFFFLTQTLGFGPDATSIAIIKGLT